MPAENEDFVARVAYNITSSPPALGTYHAYHLQHEGAEYWHSQSEQTSNLVFILETDLAHILARFEWKGLGRNYDPAKMSLEAQHVGGAWTTLSTWDARQTSDWQAREIHAGFRSKKWRLTLLTNHGNPSAILLNAVRLLVRFAPTPRVTLDSPFKDIVVVVGERRIHVHRAALAEGSPVFKRMLLTDMEETRTGEIRLEDFDEASVETTLRYIYTGTVAEQVHFGVALMAHKYDIPDLLRIAAPLALQNVTAENVTSALRMLKPHRTDDALGEYWRRVVDLVHGSRELLDAALTELS